MARLMALTIRVSFFGDQGKGFAAAFGPPGSTDTVNIRLGGGGDIEIDHMGNSGDIDAAGRDVRGHQDLEFSGTEGRSWPPGVAPGTGLPCSEVER
jgi:hypothetical protein